MTILKIKMVNYYIINAEKHPPLYTHIIFVQCLDTDIKVMHMNYVFML